MRHTCYATEKKIATILYTEMTGNEIGYVAVPLESDVVKEVGSTIMT
jgi:hypothetical protein